MGEEVLAGTEIPGGGGRGTGRDRDSRRWGKRYWQGPRFQEVGEEGDYLTLLCHHQNDSCILIGIDENRFDVSLIVWTKLQDLSLIHI